MNYLGKLVCTKRKQLNPVTLSVSWSSWKITFNNIGNYFYYPVTSYIFTFRC